MPVTGIDHLALPTADAERLAAFSGVLGFSVVGLDDWRSGRAPMFSIACGDQKINVHPETLVPLRGHPAYLRGDTAEPGCGDVCVVWDGGTDALLALLARLDIRPIEGPVPRYGGRGGSTTLGISVYVRDTDQNLLELISYAADDLERYRDAGPAR